jgi:cytochrome P450
MTKSYPQWILIELCRKPELQEKLRAELNSHFSDNDGRDPTWDELASSSVFPYLDAVVHETLRLHPPVAETYRVVRGRLIRVTVLVLTYHEMQSIDVHRQNKTT